MLVLKGFSGFLEVWQIAEMDNPSVICFRKCQPPLHRGAERQSRKLAGFFTLPPLCKGRWLSEAKPEGL